MTLRCINLHHSRTRVLYHRCLTVLSRFTGGSHWTACLWILTSLKLSSLAQALDSDLSVLLISSISATFKFCRRNTFVVSVLRQTIHCLLTHTLTVYACKAANYHVRALRHILKSVTTPVALSIASTMIWWENLAWMTKSQSQRPLVLRW